MKKSILTATVTLGFVLTGSALAAEYSFFPLDTTIDYVMPDYAIVGYANSSDYSAKTNGSSPHVILTQGAHVTGRYGDQGLHMFNQSRVDMIGGQIDGAIVTYDSSRVHIGGGTAYCMLTYDDSVIDITAGSIGDNVLVFDRSIVNVSGSAAIGYGLWGDGGTINMQGGYTPILFASWGLVTMTGGAAGYAATSGGVLNIYGGSPGSMSAYEGGVCNLFGRDLVAALVQTGTWNVYALSGHLQDGTDITGRQIQTASGGSFTITNIPEPATMLLLALGVSAIRKHRGR